MRETPRSQGTAGDTGAEHPQPRFGRAFAHTTGDSGSGTPCRSDGHPPQTPRGVWLTDADGRPGTTPPVPGRPAHFPERSRTPRRSHPLLRRSRPLFRGSRLLFALCALLFSLITWQAAAGGPLRAADERLGLALARQGPRPLTEFLADLGGMPVALPVLAVVIGYAVWRGQRAGALAVALAMAAVPVLVVPLKIWIGRPGPLTEATGYYPSGHTATAMVAYGGSALLLAPYLRLSAGTRRNRAVPVAVLLTLATGTGLVLRGYHWPLDVLGSLALCGMLLLVLRRVLRALGTPGTPAKRPRLSRSTRRSSGRTPTG
ncbi:phosphatase PAP2 family protein [Streptomyces sp. NPDC056244]|uniref:phosphatase PAP2 family protein n=1 Tax=Streptomyces sp. NPDC056244 TaxID=3345762 RepID=UPI0035DEB376